MELLDRWYAKVDVRDEDDCWFWQAHILRSGYGQFKHPETTLAHRAGYLMLVGAIPDGLELDHLCRNKACVNPRHLEVVTNRQNIKRAFAVKSCPGDHEPRWGERKVGGTRARYCLECQKVRSRQNRQNESFREQDRQRTRAWRERRLAGELPIENRASYNRDIGEAELGAAAIRNPALDSELEDPGTVAASPV